MSNNASLWPVLRPEEWQGLDRGRAVTCIGVDSGQFIGFAHEPDTEGEGVQIDDGSHTASIFEAENVRRLIAIANAALPDDDPRKITRTSVDAIRSCAARLEADVNARLMTESLTQAMRIDAMTLHRIADGLESYLAPEVE